jgi:hypothetical protein
VTRAVALRAGVPLADAAALLEDLPVRLALLDAGAEGELAAELLQLGAGASEHPVAGGTGGPAPCPTHPRVGITGACARCGAPLCAVCVANAPDRRAPECPRCAEKRQRSRAFFLIRVAVLLMILFGVVVYALRDTSSRESRTDWTRTLRVAVVLVAREPLEEGVGERAKERAVVLASKLEHEMRRYRTAGEPPFSFQVFGPVRDDGPIPALPEDEGLVEGARYAWDLWRFTSRLDDAAGVHDGAFDSRIYVLATRPVSAERKTVEGASQLGGRVGVVQVELDTTMVDLALFVTTHELFHTLGATDRYDESGRPMVPDGLPEPDRRPLYPQRLAEVMARHRATSPTASVPPKSLDELFVGEVTARELRWR